jgi:sulfate permease, SulP family
MLNTQAFRPRLLDALKTYNRTAFFKDLGAGLTVGIVALPLAMAFGIASGVKPENGLFTAVVAGFLISALGGSSVQIGGPAGAFIVVVYGIIERYGLANLLIATMLAGVLLFLMGWFKIGALVRYIPVSIVIGFTNGIAVLIALSQVKDLLGLSIAKMPGDFFAQIGTLARHLDSFNPIAFAMGTTVLGVLFLWPRLGLKAARSENVGLRTAARIPGPIIVLVAAAALTALLDLPVDTIGTRFGGIPQSLPAFDPPDFEWATAKQLLMPTITIALLGAIESLLCARVADNLSPLPRHDPNQELMAQGVANFVAPFFGGIPATGTIARTVTNVRAGAASPVAGIVHALVLLGVMLAAAPLASSVPLPALSGILLFVAWNMGEWHEFARLRQFRLPYRTILLATFLTTVILDLTVAVELGLVLACGFFIYRMSTLFRAEPLADVRTPAGVHAVRLHGSLFFGSVGALENLPKALAPGTHTLVLEAGHLIFIDTTGIDALTQLQRALTGLGVRLVICSLDEQPAGLVARSGLAALLGDEGVQPDLATAFARCATAPQAAPA